MKIQRWSLPLFIALTACSSSAITQNTQTVSSVANSESVRVETSSSVQAHSASSDSPIPVDQALDRTFSSKKLRIAFRYPSTALVGDCKDPIAVTALEKEYSVEFTLAHPPDPACASLPGVFNIIYAQRAGGVGEIREFVDKVFSPDCAIQKENQSDWYEENGDEFTHVFLQSKNPPTDSPDFACSEALVWDRTAGVVMFSPLGSKTGGGIHWPSPKPILMPDGSTESAFDGLIMQSIRFLKP